MRPIPIPDGTAEAMGGRRIILGVEESLEGAPLDPCEYVLTPSTLYPGRPCVHALVELDDTDREAIANGAHIWLTLDGGEWPWSLTVELPGK